MRASSAASLLLALGLIHPANLSFSALPEDLEGSEYDQDSSGSGSGDWSEQVSPGEITNTPHRPKSKDQNFDGTHWPAKDTESYVIMANSKSFLENQQIFAGIVAGGLTGVTLAATLVAILIYKWHNRDYGGYILGKHIRRE
ncbi:syndecan-4-like [Xiphias gladius]|uniref:syndecan-4-like n=1 Tax=Xiphias gladius TaxID=8245 RepID=UPI001A98A9EB|nr:syndecan-4-like [Xiphias gladius]